MIRVAIADDSPFTCNLLASYIEAGGDCQVVGMAHDARATLDLIRGEAPDVLTLDLQMPGGDGLELLKELTGEPSTAVVVISGVTRLAAATTLRATSDASPKKPPINAPSVSITRTFAAWTVFASRSS